MAVWSLNRPEEHCSEGEVAVARHLQRLPDDWVVRWGFFYTDRNDVRREGDFLILAPFGGVLVLEVKGGVPRQFSATGQWEGDHRDNPLTQLDAEWISVVKSLKGTPAQSLYVAKALGLPAVTANPDSDRCHGLSRDGVLAGNELADLSLLGQAMMRFFKPAARGGGVQAVTEEARDAFLDIYGGGCDPVSVKHFLDHTEARFRQRLISEYQMLDMLQGNRQLLVEGGCGSGKSWYAMEQARRYANEGKTVLFLAYNRALTRTLRMDVACDKGHGLLGGGNIVVKNYEELSAAILGDSLDALLPPGDATKDVLSHFYEVELPTKVLAALRSFAHFESLTKYDALVVDEGQDHDTSLHPEVANKFREAACGWWSIYWAMLKDQCDAPMAIFYDQSQRPVFRSSTGFEPERIRASLSQAVYVRLARSVRYTRPLFDFLTSLRGEGADDLIASLGDGRQLPEGPAVEIKTAENETRALRDQIADTVSKWERDGLCVPEEVLVLYARSDLAGSVIGETDKLGKYPLIGHHESGKGIRHCSIHKAKGLDSKAVILAGVTNPSHQEMGSYDRFTLFMGASRARQILAVLA
ncbi:MAG: NERD domain-containing protein [Akkermansiaceae bacterium]|nr:NERD domain-containing protein [Akkermansiaceae bacterium]